MKITGIAILLELDGKTTHEVDLTEKQREAMVTSLAEVMGYNIEVCRPADDISLTDAHSIPELEVNNITTLK